MWQYAAKILVTALVVVAVSELGKRSSFWGAALASLPLTSVLAFVWLHIDGGKPEQIANLAQSIFWLVMPSLLLFLLLPVLLRAGVQFWLSLGISCVVTAIAYAAMVGVLSRVGGRV